MIIASASADNPLELLRQPQNWTAPRPAELHRVRREVREHLTNPLFIAKTIDKYRNTVTGTDPLWFREQRDRSGNHDAQVRELLSFEADLLGGTPLYHVDTDLASMAVGLADTPSTQPLDPAYLPSQSGFMIFAEPIGGFAVRLVDKLGYGTMQRPVWLDPNATRITPIVGASWARGVVNDVDSLHVAFYTPTPAKLWSLLPGDMAIGVHPETGRVITAGWMDRSQQRQLREENGADPVWHFRCLLPLGRPLPSPRLSTTAQAWVRALYAVFQLHSLRGTTNPVSETDTVHVPAGERKRDRRAGILDTDDVHVIRMHSRYRVRPGDPANPGQPWGPLDFRVPVGLYRQKNKCLDTHRHKYGTCRHEERPVRFHLRGPEGAPIRWRVNWLTLNGRRQPTEPW